VKEVEARGVMLEEQEEWEGEVMELVI